VGGPSEDRREYRKDSSLVMRSSSQNRQARTADGRCQEPGGARVRVEGDRQTQGLRTLQVDQNLSPKLS